MNETQGLSVAKGVRLAFSPVEAWSDGSPAFTEEAVEFVWHKGMSLQQRQRSVASMHQVITSRRPDQEPLEVSTRAIDFDLGRALSAFNLSLRGYPVENIFQAAKVMNDGGPYPGLLKVEAAAAKRDCRIQTRDSKSDCQANNVRFRGRSSFETSDEVCRACRSRADRHLAGFRSRDFTWGLEPKSLFYDALYITALMAPQNRDLASRVSAHSVFTDIAFNQKVPYAEAGPFNCQARSCAIFTTLVRSGLEESAIADLVRDPARMSRLYDRPDTLESEQGQLSWE